MSNRTSHRRSHARRAAAIRKAGLVADSLIMASLDEASAQVVVATPVAERNTDSSTETYGYDSEELLAEVFQIRRPR